MYLCEGLPSSRIIRYLAVGIRRRLAYWQRSQVRPVYRVEFPVRELQVGVVNIVVNCSRIVTITEEPNEVYPPIRRVKLEVPLVNKPICAVVYDENLAFGREVVEVARCLLVGFCETRQSGSIEEVEGVRSRPHWEWIRRRSSRVGLRSPSGDVVGEV